MLLSLVFGFISGIALGSFTPVSAGFFIILIVFILVVFSYKYFVSEEHHRVLFIVAVFLVGVLFGIGRVGVSDLYSQSKLVDFVGQKINTEGIVVAEPDQRETNTKLTVKLSKYNERILVTVPLYPEFHYGDKVLLEVTPSEPQAIESEDGRVFDYSGYLRVRGIWYTSRYTTIKLLSAGHGSLLKTALYKTKNAFISSIDKALPEPESNLLGGLLLGAKQSLGKELLTEFQRTGVSHIVVLSGYNIAIVASSIMSVFKFLPKNLSFGFGATSIILFTILSGGGASAVRAAIMVLVALFAKKFNRDYKADRVLGLTVVLMLLQNPLLLVFDPSFQLSILATIGLIFVSSSLTPYLTKVPEKLWNYIALREIVSTTIATQITVLPFLIYNMGLLSLVALPVNVLILGTIPLTMLFGFITGFVGLFSLYLSFIPAFFTYLLLWYQLRVVHLGASVPFGAVSLPAFSPLILIGIYGVIFGILYCLKK